MNIKYIGAAAAALGATASLVSGAGAASQSEENWTAYVALRSEIGSIPGLSGDNIWLTCRDGDDPDSTKIVQVTNELLDQGTYNKYQIPASCYPRYNPDPSNSFEFFIEPHPGPTNFEKICGGTTVSLNNGVVVRFFLQKTSKKITCEIKPGPLPKS
ncbi:MULTISPECIES: hypothetical protein [Kordiimonas]|uniref:Uncharacterized protein n=1 Tax=Kordiimonas lacus TaxID=637679 RepID=A0A1G6TUV5_9PROT|nr:MULTISPECIES: hypothetical protein [Kordiimonas]SDD32819.1 hypothetical protein SAMN04488071_0365 [Kordiimonas lacus]